MTDRQRLALAHPLTTGQEDVGDLRTIEPQPDGNLLASILAVDR